MKDKKKIKLLIVEDEPSKELINFFEEIYDVELYTTKTFRNLKMSELDIAVFTSGEDINPKEYGEKTNSKTVINQKRDNSEFDIYHSLNRSVLKIGIGRGAQLLTVLAGGKIIQDVTGHNDTQHQISINRFGTYLIDSKHHQLMYPYNINEKNYSVFGWSRQFQSTHYLNGKDEEFKTSLDFLEVEIVNYSNIKALCFQYHIEDSKSDLRKISQIFISEALDNKYESKKKDREFEDEFEREVPQRYEPQRYYGDKTGVSKSSTGISQSFEITPGVKLKYGSLYDTNTKIVEQPKVVKRFETEGYEWIDTTLPYFTKKV